MLIIGGSRGVGRAVAESFRDEFSVITVARSNADRVGDICDPLFVKSLMKETDPFIVENSAGIYPNEKNLLESVRVNYMAAVELTMAALEKMPTGFIFNISSIAASLFPNQRRQDIFYYNTKKALSDFGHALQFKNKTDVKVCTIEPGFIMTDMANIRQRFESKEESDYLNHNKITPMEPSYIADVIRWIINQPAGIVIENIKLMNKVR